MEENESSTPPNSAVCFAFVIDGEVATNLCFHGHDEKMIAIMSSNPQVILNPKWLPPGSIWDGEKFYNPLGD